MEYKNIKAGKYVTYKGEGYVITGFCCQKVYLRTTDKYRLREFAMLESLDERRFSFKVQISEEFVPILP